MNSSISIRLAQKEDVIDLLSIYTPYVEQTAITFEYDVPSIDEFSKRIEQTLIRYPYLVLCKDDKICGYAYASTFKPRAAYDFSVETTIYLDASCKGQGLGTLLYGALETVLLKQNIINVNACITPASPPYVTEASELFHAKLGYKKVAHFTQCGYKFKQWFDVIWMEKFIAEHTVSPSPFIPFSQLDRDEVQRLLYTITQKS